MPIMTCKRISINHLSKVTHCVFSGINSNVCVFQYDRSCKHERLKKLIEENKLLKLNQVRVCQELYVYQQLYGRLPKIIYDPRWDV